MTSVDDASGTSRLQRDASDAQDYLSRVIRDHEGTPWALLAKRELDQPLGWRWKETFTPIDPPAERIAANNKEVDNLPRDERARDPTPAQTASSAQAVVFEDVRAQLRRVDHGCIASEVFFDVVGIELPAIRLAMTLRNCRRKVSSDISVV